MSLAEDATPCTVCGGPVLWGTRHPVCGQRVMAAEALDLDQLKRIVNAKEAAQRAAMWREADPASPLNADGAEDRVTPAHTCANAGTSSGACKTHCGDKTRCWGTEP